MDSETHTGDALGETTYSRVRKALLADIVNGHFEPGARLKIAELSKRYGLSQMPIREALQQLQGEGLVVIMPHKGASVRALDHRFLTDVYEIRIALSGIYYRDAVAFADAEFDAKLEEIQKGFDVAMERENVSDCNECNRQFHFEIESRCLNEEAVRAGMRYKRLTGSLRDLFGFQIERLRDISGEHWAIINAIKARDTEAAIAAGRKHIALAQASMEQNFD
ncbi:GntR family transcriptional regulator [Pacificibacter marinus]|uniref:GntR family transcriptional regulator n=1 Tax=Pacificibacter marinus TaxID=658057 RepID=UPI001C06FA5D|nr:GntR family transcriptional regulator [Pacificibacter marinus]MBU2867636.1 GntR family transcriptional regulator [Pacificibacter marinus]